MDDYLLWSGVVNGIGTRIVKFGDNDCIVEIAHEDGDEWHASDDDAHCHRTYIEAFLEVQKIAKLFKMDA